MNPKLDDNTQESKQKQKRPKSTRSIAQSLTVIPFFLEQGQALSIGQKLDRISDSPYPSKNLSTVVYPPTSIPYTTFSKRFPYDPPARATSSQQEFRMKILKSESFNPIKHSQQRGNQLSSSMIEQSPLNNRAQSQRNISTKPMSPLMQKLNLNSQSIEKRLNSNNQQGNPIKNLKEMLSPNQYKGHQSQQNKEQFPSSKQGDRVKIEGPEYDKSNPKRFCPNQINISKSEVFIHDRWRAGTAESQRPDEIQALKVRLANLKSKLAEQESQASLSESFMQSQIHKWEVKKKQKLQKEQKIQKYIDNRFSNIMEEKANKPTHVATNFINDLKNFDENLSQLTHYQSEEKKRYLERLKSFHIKKYHTFFSDFKLHTAQLPRRHENHHQTPLTSS